MIKIGSASETQRTARAKKTAKANAAFTPAAAGAGASSATSKTASLSAPSTLSALIALQTRDGASKKTFVAAQRILDALDALRLRLLNGEATRDDVEALAVTAELRAHAGVEPRLVAIYDEIALRARVELAKLGG